MHGQDFRDINAIPSGWKLSAYSAVISSQLRQCHRSQGVLSQTGISRLGLQPQGEFPCSSMCSFSQLMITVVWGLGLVVWNPTIFFEKGLWVTMIKELPQDSSHRFQQMWSLLQPCCRGCGLEDLGRARVNGWNCQGPVQPLKTLLRRDQPGQVAYGLPDGHAIESVLMPYQETWRTQCGCFAS